jgi:2-C-methyl-D-erythritol 4-phosphate cytidylyltransferase
MHVSKHIIIVAGGTGSRMNSTIPKQFIEVNGKPILAHTIQKFLDYDKTINIIIVSHRDFLNDVLSLLAKYFNGKNIQTCVGGAARFDSVKNGLNLLKDKKGLVGIHDAARPMVSILTIKSAFDEAEKNGNGIPVIQMNESIRHNENGNSKAVDRNHFTIVQTPQCFKLELIQKAFEQDYKETFTDDATVLESIGEKINLTQGNPENIKITNPGDLLFAQAILK